jgi:hypothetical protein
MEKGRRKIAMKLGPNETANLSGSAEFAALLVESCQHKARGY